MFAIVNDAKICTYKNATILQLFLSYQDTLHAAQEAGAPHCEYIDRKKENVIFIPM